MDEQVIRKRIGIDNSRSHIQGLLPFVVNDGAFEYVDPLSSDGNFGRYVCDFAIKKYEAGKGSKEIDRLRYCDLISRYHFVENELNISVKLKRVEKLILDKEHINKKGDDFITSGTTEKIVCFNNDNDKPIVNIYNSNGSLLGCKEGNRYLSSDYDDFSKYKVIYTWVEDFNRKDCNGNWTDNRSKYEFTPVDGSLFGGTDGVYKLYDESLMSDYSDAKFEYIALFGDNYEKAISYLNEWDADPEQKDGVENRIKSWRKFLGFESISYEPYKPIYNMCLDIETKILGKIYVPETFESNGEKLQIVGSRVPQYIYFSDVNDRKNWFKSIEAKSTVTNGVRKWSNAKDEILYLENGGEEFKAFLETISISNITSGTYPENNSGEQYICFVQPYIPINLLLTDNSTSEDVKTPYETDDDAYKYGKFSAYTEMSAVTTLAPIYVSNDTEFYSGITSFGQVESQITSVVSPKAFTLADDLFGIWEEFALTDTSDESNQFFKCTYHTGWSETGITLVYTSGWQKTVTIKQNEDGSEYEEYGKPRAIARKLVGTINETLPYAKDSSSYQIIGVEKLGNIQVVPDVIITATTETSNGGEPIKEIIQFSAETKYDYGWWECVKVTKELECADGEPFDGSERDKVYRTVTVLESVPQVAPASIKDGEYYYFLSKQDNGYTWENGIGGSHEINDRSGSESKLFKLPYEVSKIVEKDKYDEGKYYGNMLLSETFSANEITLKYVIGGNFNGNTYDGKSGIVYSETRYYDIGTKKVDLDEADNVNILYETTTPITEKVYSEEYLLTRKAQKATIIGMEIASVWTSATSVCTKLISQDNTEGMQSDPRVNFSLTIDRGNASAWENHFKLTECNTLEDLENYGNNYFNL